MGASSVKDTRKLLFQALPVKEYRDFLWHFRFEKFRKSPLILLGLRGARPSQL